MNRPPQRPTDRVLDAEAAERARDKAMLQELAEIGMELARQTASAAAGRRESRAGDRSLR